MATIEANIEGALFERVSTLVLAPALRIAWPNVDFDPVGNETYLEVRHLPNRVDRLFIGSNDPQRHQGILQIDVRGSHNEHAIDFTEVAGQVAAHFPTDLRLTSENVNVRVTRRPSIAASLRDGPYWVVPVSVYYEAIK